MIGRFDAANDEEQQRVEDVENSQLLVIHGDNPVVQPFADGPGILANCARARLILTPYAISSLSSQRHRDRP